ncbi:MAG: hypothetical protein E6G47_00995 [Actinobacteria bacterium]|nr:MAG: hypothetical protein E6G47_00995 [Actinomycetota bacterium]
MEDLLGDLHLPEVVEQPASTQHDHLVATKADRLADRDREDADVDHVVVGVLVVRLDGREQERLRRVGHDLLRESGGDALRLFHRGGPAGRDALRGLLQELHAGGVAPQEFLHGTRLLVGVADRPHGVDPDAGEVPVRVGLAAEDRDEDRQLLRVGGREQLHGLDAGFLERLQQPVVGERGAR